MSRSIVVSVSILFVVACNVTATSRDAAMPLPDADRDARDVLDAGSNDAGYDGGGTLDSGLELFDSGSDAHRTDAAADGGSRWGLAADPSFGVGGVTALNGGVSDGWSAASCAVGSDGSVVIAGATTTGDALFVRLDATGALDTTFGDRGAVVRAYGSAPAEARDVFVLADGRIAALVLGDHDDIVRLTASGDADATFDGDGIAWLEIFGVGVDVRALAASPDGRVAVAGRVWESALTTRHDYVFARYLADGSLDPAFDDDGRRQLSFSSSTDEDALTLAMDAPDAMVFGGVAGDDAHTTLGRLVDTGIVDTTFGAAGAVLPAAQSGSVAIVALPFVTLHASVTQVSRFDAFGAPDATFGSGGNATFDGRPLRSMVARAGRDVWVTCDGEGALRGLDWTGTPLASGDPLSVPPVRLTSGVASAATVTRLCTGASGEVVAIGNAREGATSTARGIFVARFTGP